MLGGLRRPAVRVHPRLGPRQPGRAPRSARPHLPARPGAQRRLPRALHQRSPDLPLHDGRRVAARAPQRGPPGAHHGHPVVRLHLGDAALAGPRPRRGRGGVVRAALPPRTELPAPRGTRLHAPLDGHRRRHREVRRDDERHPPGAGVPPGGRQRRRVRRTEQAPRAHQRRRAAGDGPLCRRLPAGRQHGGRTDRAVGRLPGGGRLTGAGRAGGGGAVPAPPLRPDRPPGHVPQLLPVGGGLTGEDRGPAGPDPVGPRRPPSPANCRPWSRSTPAARSSSTASASATAPAARSSPASTSPSPRARRSRSSAPRAPASRPSPSSSPVSTTRRRAGSSSTASTCATCPCPNSGAGS